jgi:hypothetical protein
VVLKRILLVAMLVIAPVARADGLHRFAVIVGNDKGGSDTRPLLYARADAQKVYDILTRLGGVAGADAQLVLDGSAQDLLAALALTERRAGDARARGERTTLIFYYSGHAKDGALRLGDPQLPLDSRSSTRAARASSRARRARAARPRSRSRPSARATRRAS